MENILDEMKAKLPGSSDQVRFFAYVSNGICSQMLDNTNVDGDITDAVELCKVLGATCLLNTSTNSNGNEKLKGKIDLTYERFQEVVHKLQLASPEKGATETSLVAVPELQKMYREACASFNAAIKPFRRQSNCLDDDIQTTLSAQAEKGK